MSAQAIMTLVLFLAVIVLLIWQPVSPIVIGAGIPVILSVFNVVEPSKAFSQFSNTTVIFFMSLLVVGGAIFKTGLADFIGEKVINLLGTNEKGVIAGTALIVTALSAFLNDTGTTGCLIPIASAVGKKSKVSLSKIYIVLAFFASLGGMITLIGGGGHLVVQGFLEESAYEGFTFFEFVRIGLPIALISFIWLMFFGIKDLAVREVDESNIPDTAERKPAKMVFVALIFLFIVYCMATKLLAMHVAAALGAFLVVITGCISAEDAVKSFSVNTFFLVAGIFTLSSAMSSTGAAQYLVDSMSGYMSNMHPIVVVALVTLISVVGTNFMMGTSLCAILTPMSIMIGEACGISPHALAMCVAIGTSAAFCTPFGTGPNLLVYEIGGLKFKDYTKAGLPYAIFTFVICTAAVYFFYLV